MRNPYTFEFYINSEVWDPRIRIHIRQGKKYATNIVFEEKEPGAISSPLMSLQREEAQDLVDQLYAQGIMPNMAKGSSGQLTAVQYHLEDMRKLVFKENK